MKFREFPIDRIEWITTAFLGSTLLLSLTVAPWFTWKHWGDPSAHWGFVAAVSFLFYVASGLSITLGYHRLFAHLSFKAKWPVKLATLVFGAAAFENSAYTWAADHRKHHKHVDEDDDPYDISKGFFYAHIGWLLFKLKPMPPFTNVKDLEKDALVMWQHRWCHVVGALFGFGLPFVLGLAWGGLTCAWACFLFAGLLRTIAVQQSTFCINSLCHTLGRQPYSTEHSARDSWVCALVTFGEGYHNYHHEFQHDYRNGVKPWQFDPTKWSIWLLSKLGMASELRRVPEARILAAEMTEARRHIEERLEDRASRLSEATKGFREDSIQAVRAITEELGRLVGELQASAAEKIEVSREQLSRYQKLVHQARRHLDDLLLPQGLVAGA